MKTNKIEKDKNEDLFFKQENEVKALIDSNSLKKAIILIYVDRLKILKAYMSSECRMLENAGQNSNAKIDLDISNELNEFLKTYKKCLKQIEELEKIMNEKIQ